MTNQSVSPVANSPLGHKNEEVSQGFLEAFIVNEQKMYKNRSYISKNESGKSTSLDKRAPHSGVTAHTFSSSLKSKLDKKNQQAIMNKYQGRGKGAKNNEEQLSGFRIYQNLDRIS